MKEMTNKYHGYASSKGCDYRVTNNHTEHTLYFMRRWEAEKYITLQVENDIWDMEDFTLYKFNAVDWTWKEIANSLLRYRVRFEFQLTDTEISDGKWHEDFLNDNGKGFTEEEANRLADELSEQSVMYVRYITIEKME